MQTFYLRVHLPTFAKLVKNAYFLVKIFICKFSICGPKWRNLSTANNEGNLYSIIKIYMQRVCIEINDPIVTTLMMMWHTHLGWCFCFNPPCKRGKRETKSEVISFRKAKRQVKTNLSRFIVTFQALYSCMLGISCYSSKDCKLEQMLTDCALTPCPTSNIEDIKKTSADMQNI